MLRFVFAPIIITYCFLKEIANSIFVLFDYYRAITYTLVGHRYANFPVFNKDKKARIFIFSLGSIYTLWNSQHYRGGTFSVTFKKQIEEIKSFEAFYFSIFLRNRFFFSLFLFIGFPILCYIKSVISQGFINFLIIPKHFRENLLYFKSPLGFFITSSIFIHYQWLTTKSSNFQLDNLIQLYQKATDIGLATSKLIPQGEIVIKHKNIEGGMGIHFFKNILSHPSGDWIIKEQPEIHFSLIENFPELKLAGCEFHVFTHRRASIDHERDDPVEIISCFLKLYSKIPEVKPIYYNIDFNTKIIDSQIKNEKGSKSWILLNIFNSKNNKKVQVIPSNKKISQITEITKLAAKLHSELFKEIPLLSSVIKLTSSGPIIDQIYFSSCYFRYCDNKQYFSIIDERLPFYEILHAANVHIDPSVKS